MRDDSHTEDDRNALHAAATSTQPLIAAHVLLQELRRFGIIHPEDWKALAAASQTALSECSLVPALIQMLVEHRLLTEYQARRIRHGESFGLTLGNYRVLERLGVGGMGTVYLGEHRRLRKHVAIKVLTVLPGHESTDEMRFAAEIRAVAKLEHPNIVGVFDAGDEGSPDSFAPMLHYYVMEYVPGHSLEELVASEGPLPVERACDILYQIGGALDKAHRHGLIHRDIKPSNVMATPEGHAKLLDFGIARHQRQRVTEAGVALGSLGYMAPEQAQDASSVDVRADVFGMGSTLYWCLTGKPPYPVDKGLANALIRRAKAGPPPRVRVHRPEISARLDEVVARMMAFDPNDRFASAEAAQSALRPFLKMAGRSDTGAANAAPPTAGTSTPSPSPSHRILLVDDEPYVRSICRFLLESQRIKCKEAGDGAEALEMLRVEPFDLLLLDVDLPVMIGPQVCKRLREQPPCPNLKIIMLSGRATADEMAQMMLAGADDFLSKPFSNTQLEARVKALLRLKDAQDRSDSLNHSLRQFTQQLEDTVNARDIDLIHARNAIVLALAKLAEYRDNETGAHLMRLERYCRCLAEEAAQSPAFTSMIDATFIEMLACCAPLHDIGKVGVPDHILHKPGKLDVEERQIMQTHTIIGSETLRQVASQHGFAMVFLHMAADIARHHHERFDGTGYPDRLLGNDIPLAARIVAVADVYDALRSRRVYKPAFPHNQTVQIINEGFHTQFDPALLEPFQRSMTRFEEIFASAKLEEEQ